MVYAALAPFEESTQSPPGGAVKQRRARPAANLCAQLGLEASQQGLGRIGGKLAGHIGENRFVVGAADDGRSKCQSILCREYLRPGEPRIGKRPPSAKRVAALVDAHNAARAGDNAPPRRQPKTTLSAPAAAAVLGAAVVPAPPARGGGGGDDGADDAAGDAAPAPGGGAPDLLTLMAVASSAYDRIAPPAGRAVSDGSASGGSVAAESPRSATARPSTTTSTPRRRRPSRARSRPPRVAPRPFFFPRRRGRDDAQVARSPARGRDPADVAAAARRGALAFERAFDRALARHATPAAAALETAADSPL
ncbi:N-acylsphingosine amidohydrolase [Aureococcus anophagefferens]|nr:N-acylsphingosine amidohydrolase [Aureococcus anophagefferens]